MKKFAPLLIALLLTACQNIASVSATSNDSTHASAEKVAAAMAGLKNGGYVVVMRHGATDPNDADTDPYHLEQCGNQRLLTDRGRLAASGIGKQLHRAGMQVDGQVITSRYCRAIETGEYLGFGPVKSTDDISESGMAFSPNESLRRDVALQKLVATIPAVGKDMIIVTHKPNIQAALKVYDPAEGEILIYREAKLIWRITPRDFSNYDDIRKSSAL
ncbi:MAG: histidine phosphatase family protein [bacterium]|nr:histidine phosphatase family protein [bacterium]